VREIRLSSEQEMLLDAARRFLAERYDFRHRTGILGSAAGYDRGVWRQFAEMGWLGLALPQVHGGNGTLFDAALLMEAFGKALVVEPYLPTVVLCGQLIACCASDAQQHRLLPAIIAGETLLALAHGEPQSGYDTSNVMTTAARAGKEYLLDGRKAVVLGAPMAERLIVSARTAGSQHERRGLSLFLVDLRAEGVRMVAYRTIDGGRAADIVFEGVTVPADDRLGPEGEAAAALDHALAAGAVALTSQAVGALEGAVEATARHLNTREQFGQKLAAFQALRHRVADMYVAKEEARALARLAAADFDAADPSARDLSIAAAKAYAGDSGRRVCEEAVQLHGAIGITDEIMVGHYLKKLIAIDRTFADATACLDRFMAGSPALRSDAPAASALGA
jgi:alkylation response protein AidB-like acyl-CoA dehydrogenase